MYTLIIENGYKEYEKNKEKIEICRNINLKLEEGKMYGIIGQSGSGKTTLLNIMGTLNKLTKGTLLIDNKDVSILNDDELAMLRMKNIGFVFQSFLLNKYMTVEENVLEPLLINKKYSKEDRKRRVEKLIEEVGLSERKKHFPRELSGGEEQRVAIARALANDPKIILADEPTGNLDKKNEIKIFEIIKKLSKEGKCIVVVSHSSIIKEYADVIFNLEEGLLKFYEY